MLAAEDARPTTPHATAPVGAGETRGSRPPGARSPDPLTPLYDGLTSLPDIQATAVRRLGRPFQSQAETRFSAGTRRGPKIRAPADPRPPGWPGQVAFQRQVLPSRFVERALKVGVSAVGHRTAIRRHRWFRIPSQGSGRRFQPHPHRFRPGQGGPGERTQRQAGPGDGVAVAL